MFAELLTFTERVHHKKTKGVEMRLLAESLPPGQNWFILRGNCTPAPFRAWLGCLALQLQRGASHAPLPCG